MSNPYAPPKAPESDEPSIHLAEDAPFKVAGDSLICREEVDVSQYCYETGEAPVLKKRKRTLQFLPRALQLAMNIVFPFMALAILASAVLDLGFEVRDFWPVFFFPLIASILAGSKVTMAFSLSETVERQRSRKMWLIVSAIALFGMVELVFSQLPPLMGRRAFHGFLGLVMLIGMLYSIPKRHVRVNRLSNGLFRIDNLPTQLLAKLRDHDQFGNRDASSATETMMEPLQ